MKRIKLTIAYDGTNYSGWQIQKNAVTIEEIIDNALCELLQEEIKIIGASRTDAGVHACGNVAVFDTETRIPPEKIAYALNQRLPKDIVIQDSREVDAEFHPRFCDCTKTYEYQIFSAPFPNPSKSRYCHYTYRKLDVDKMRAASSFLVGRHDFKSFCTVGAQVQSTIRIIYGLEVFLDDGIIVIQITGNGFLYNMVRIIAGTLMEVGMGNYSPEHVGEILAAKDRQKAGPTAPACGLTLVEIQYDDYNEEMS